MKKRLVCMLLLAVSLTACGKEEEDVTPDNVVDMPNLVDIPVTETTPESTMEPTPIPVATPTIDPNTYAVTVSGPDEYPIIYSTAGAEGTSKMDWFTGIVYEYETNEETAMYYDIVAAGIAKLYDYEVEGEWYCDYYTLMQGYTEDGSFVIRAVGETGEVQVVIAPGPLWDTTATIGICAGVVNDWSYVDYPFDVEIANVPALYLPEPPAIYGPEVEQ